jgi:hypothetical protein
MEDAARMALDGLEISGKILARDVGVFAVDAVIEELAHRDALDQLRHAPHRAA